MPKGHAKSLALADGVVNDSFVSAQDVSGFIDIISFTGHCSIFMVNDKIRIVTVSNEADLLRIGF